MEKKQFALSVRLILTDNNNRILLLKRSRDAKTNPGRWELPGGKIDTGESFDMALYREVFEETGLRVRIHHAAGTAEQMVSGLHVIHLILTGTVESGGLAISDEHEAFRWSAIEEIGDLELADWFAAYWANST
jgi:8-oxo-dGTP diphosphatase